jgi:hypothetical protein
LAKSTIKGDRFRELLEEFERLEEFCPGACRLFCEEVVVMPVRVLAALC